MYGSIVFARLYQCDPIQHVLPWAHLRSHPKYHLNRFSCFCTAHGRRSLYLTMGRPFPSKLPHCVGELDLNLTHGSLGPPAFITQTASPSVQPSLHG